MPEKPPETKDHKKIKKIPSLAEDLAFALGVTLSYGVYKFYGFHMEIPGSSILGMILGIFLKGARSRWHAKIPPRTEVIEKMSVGIFIKKMLGFSLLLPLWELSASLLRYLERTYAMPHLGLYFLGIMLVSAWIYHCFFRRKSQDS